MEERWASAHLTDTTRRPHMSSTHSHATELQSTLNGATHATGTIHSVRTISRAPSPTWAARPIVEDRRSDDERELRRKDRNTVQINVASISAGVTNVVSTRLASAAAYISGYGSGYESGYHLASTPYIPSTNGNGHERVFPLQETQSPEQVADGFGLIGTHSRAGVTAEDHPTPVARERYPPRRGVTSVTNTIRSGRMSRSLSDIPLLDAPDDNGAARRMPMQSVGQVLGVDINGSGPSRLNGNALVISSHQGGNAAVWPNDLQIRMPRPQALISPLDPSPDTDSLRSETTWGTVSTGRTGSMDHLGLVGLHNGGVRGQGSLSGESVIRRLSSDEDTTDEDGEDVDMDVTPVIPTAGVADVSMLGLILEDGADYPLRTGEQPRYRTPYPAQPSHPTGDSRSRTQHSSQTGRPTHRRRHTSQPGAYDQERTTRVASPATSTYNNTNALSLHFDASLSMHDHTSSAISVPYVNVGHGPEIIAPTPVVGGPNIAHLWANRS